jgi:hypothetical protein
MLNSREVTDLCDSLRRALLDAEKRLEETEQVFLQLEAERGRLREVILSLSTYLRSHGVEIDVEPMQGSYATTTATNVKGMKAWELALSVLEEQKQPMPVPDIYESLLAKGVNMAKDAIRVAMLRKPQIFRQAGNGTYALLKWTAPEDAAWKLTLGSQSLEQVKEAS